MPLRLYAEGIRNGRLPRCFSIPRKPQDAVIMYMFVFSPYQALFASAHSLFALRLSFFGCFR